MYFAHAGHHHVEEHINKEIDPVLVIISVLAIVALVVLAVVIFDVVRKRSTAKKSK